MSEEEPGVLKSLRNWRVMLGIVQKYDWIQIHVWIQSLTEPDEWIKMKSSLRIMYLGRIIYIPRGYNSIILY